MLSFKNLIIYTCRNLLSIMLLFFVFKKFTSPEVYQNMNELISMILNDSISESIDKYDLFVHSMHITQVAAVTFMYSKKFFDYSLFLLLVSCQSSNVG